MNGDVTASGQRVDALFGWFSATELAGLAMFEDTLLLARVLFPRIGSVAAATECGNAAGALVGRVGLSRSSREHRISQVCCGTVVITYETLSSSLLLSGSSLTSSGQRIQRR